MEAAAVRDAGHCERLAGLGGVAAGSGVPEQVGEAVREIVGRGPSDRVCHSAPSLNLRKGLAFAALWVTVLALSGCGGGSDGVSQAMHELVEIESDTRITPDKTDETGTMDSQVDEMDDIDSECRTCVSGSIDQIFLFLPFGLPHVETLLADLIAASDMVINSHTANASIWHLDVEGVPSGLQLSDLAMAGPLGLESLPDHQGVSRASAEFWNEPNSSEYGGTNYAGWMDYSFFFVNGWRGVNGSALNPDEGAYAYVYSMGDTTGHNPTGGGSWLGAMTGVETYNTSELANLIEGDATITVADFGNPMVDVAFTNIVDRETGASRNDMIWSSLRLTAGSFNHKGFRVESGAWADNLNSLSGQFYGPEGEEVGGIFLRDGIAGAFGARR